MKRNLFTVLIILSVIGCSQSETDNDSFHSGNITRGGTHLYYEEGDASIQLEAIRLYKEIIEGIKISEDDKNIPSKLPNYYGGAYVDEIGKLHILIKGDLCKGIEAIDSIVGIQSIIVYEECYYSYQELTDLTDSIKKILSQTAKSIDEDVRAFYIDDRNNRVVICMNKIADSKIKKFKKEVTNHAALYFEENWIDLGEEPLTRNRQDSVSLSPGAYLENRATTESYQGSWAFRARDKYDSTKVGMVTSGHVLKYDSAFVNHTFIGIADPPLITPSVDAAFVEYSNNSIYYSSSNSMTVHYKDGLYPINLQMFAELDTATYAPIVGTTVNKRGWTTGLTTGTIINTNLTGRYRDSFGAWRTISNMTLASFSSAGGDSGGIVYTYFSIQNKRYTTGIVTAMLLSNHNVYTIFTKADLALTALEVERY